MKERVTFEKVRQYRKKLKVVLMPLEVARLHGAIAADTITLDPRSRIPLAKTLVHEVIHGIYPLWSEAQVVREERRLWNHLTWRERAEAWTWLGKAHVWNGEGRVPEVEREPIAQQEVVGEQAV